MDDIQEKVIDILQNNKDVLSDRGKLKGLLADILTDDKMHQNILLNAYDDDFISKMNNSSDKTLTALRFIKELVNNYGISDENAKWSIEVWCSALGYEEIAQAISSFMNNSINSYRPSIPSQSEYIIGEGVYCAGIDFPYGKICLVAVWEENKKHNNIYYEIDSNPHGFRAQNQSFKDKTYIDIKEGEYLFTKCVVGDGPQKIIISPVA